MFGEDDLWMLKLVNLSKLPTKTVRLHLEHLEEMQLIHYIKNRRRRGQRNPFRLSIEGWKSYLAIHWCRRLEGLIKDALETEDNLEEAMAKIDLRKIRIPAVGVLLLEYSNQLEPSNLLSIQWKIEHDHVDFTPKVFPAISLPDFGTLTRFIERAHGTHQSRGRQNHNTD